MGKKKGAKKNVVVDNEFDSIMNEFEASPPTPAPASAVIAEVVTPAAPTDNVDAAAAYLASMGLSTEDGEEKKNDKKKKKKGKKKGPATAAAPAKPTTAAAKIILERRKAQQEEEELLEKERMAEEAIQLERIRILEEEENAKIEAMQRKKDAKKARIEKAKREGTYMTKSEKVKAAKREAALEAMQAAGMAAPNVSGDTPEKKEPVVYKNKRKGGKKIPIKEIVEEKEEVEEKAPEPLESWDDGDWENEDLVANLDIPKVAEKEEDSDDEEDLLVVEQKRELEALRLQGIEIKRREEEAARLAAEEDSSSDEDSDDDGSNHRHRPKSKAQQEIVHRKKEAADRRKKREEEARAAVSLDELRSPICCIMGHVDTGKTKLLDNIRKTNVQDGEAGGITQQIGATFFPVEALISKTQMLAKKTNFVYKLPGLLVIDTPGHESFTNLRSRGSSLCDIAILVVDIMHGLEPQTLESIRLLKTQKAPFVVALNKIDRCYGWKTCVDMPIRDALAYQNENVIREFRDRTKAIQGEFSEQGLNTELYWENKDLGKTVSFVPTSAISGEGVPDILMLLAQLTQERLTKSLAFVDILQCTVLEVKVMEGLGTTVDTILVNGSLNEGDTIIVCTLDGPVVTTIRSLLTPHPMKEIRVKGEFIHHAHIKAAMGVKICAQGLEKAVAGTPVHVVGPDDDIDELKDLVMKDLTNVMDSVKMTKRGVHVQASTLGALEALLEFLENGCKPSIPVSGVNLGPVHKRDVVRSSVQLEHKPEFATILAFDVKVNSDAQELADDNGVRIFTADIIYHLFDQFTAYMDGITQERRATFGNLAVFPVILRILPECIFNKKSPMVLGCDVEEGILKVGTPLVIPTLNNLKVGRVVSIERDHKNVDIAKKGSTVAVKIENDGNVCIGRHFDATHKLVSFLTRESIDALKENFKEDLKKPDWALVVALKKTFEII